MNHRQVLRLLQERRALNQAEEELSAKVVSASEGRAHHSTCPIGGKVSGLTCVTREGPCWCGADAPAQIGNLLPAIEFLEHLEHIGSVPHDSSSPEDNAWADRYTRPLGGWPELKKVIELLQIAQADYRCHDCNACRIEQHGCPCDGALDDGCFLCTPERHKRPPCPSGSA